MKNVLFTIIAALILGVFYMHYVIFHRDWGATLMFVGVLCIGMVAVSQLAKAAAPHTAAVWTGIQVLSALCGIASFALQIISR